MYSRITTAIALLACLAAVAAPSASAASPTTPKAESVDPSSKVGPAIPPKTAGPSTTQKAEGFADGTGPATQKECDGWAALHDRWMALMESWALEGWDDWAVVAQEYADNVIYAGQDRGCNFAGVLTRAEME